MAINIVPPSGVPKPLPVKPAAEIGMPAILKGPSELALAMAKISKELGPKAIVKGSQIPQVQRLPTGVFEFDLATGGGFPFNRYSIVYGPESSGKTNLVYKAAAQAQRRQSYCNKSVFVDLEGTLDQHWGAKFGVDMDSLVVAKPSYGEQAVDMIDALVRASDVAFLAVDSVAVMVAAREVEGSTEKADVGTSALLVKRLVNKLAIALSEEQKRGHDIAVVLLNQTRMKIGVMFGDPETQPGGQTLRFNSSLTIRISGKNLMEKGISSDVPAFKETSCVVKKAKVGILQSKFGYNMTMVEHDGLMIGETDSFNQVKGYLQASGHLKKHPEGWMLVVAGLNPVVFKTLDQIKDLYRAEDDFCLSLQSQVIKNHAANAVLVAEDHTPDPKDEHGSEQVP